MENQELQQQIDILNQKMDLLLGYVEDQRRRSLVIEDLVDDVSRVGTEIFKSTITEFDHQNVTFDGEAFQSMLFKLIKSIPTLNSMLDTLQSANDLIHDVSPIAMEVIMDITRQFEILNNNGTIDALKNIGADMANPQFAKNIAIFTHAIASVKPDETIDKKSLFGLMKEMNKPEVRQSLGFLLRIAKSMNQK
ncbi:MAG: DUF1641 domain-containing protein [Bacteroidota bacterium]